MNEDLQYWGINANLMDACCLLTHYPELKYSQTEAKQDQKRREKEARTALEENFGPTKVGQCRYYLWCLTEYPERGKSGRVRKFCKAFKFIFFQCTNVSSMVCMKYVYFAFVTGLVLFFIVYGHHIFDYVCGWRFYTIQ